MKVFQGNMIYATEENPMVVLLNGLIGIENKKIVFIGGFEKLQKYMNHHGFSEEDVIHLSDSEFLMPGLIDTHIHAPQYVNAGTALDLPLLDWLEKYTFPSEKSFEDNTYAAATYTTTVKRVLKNGTTTAFYNGTIHVDATLTLCDICESLGQRALAGKVCMDQNSPDYYIEDKNSSLIDTEKYIKTVLDREYSLSSPAIVPRFAISASEDLMKGISKLGFKYKVHIQSHLAESLPECKWVKELYPSAASYTDLYQTCGILNSNSSMAHCVFLSDDELALLKSEDAGICHCPNSNISLKSGLCDVRRLIDNGIKVGLGTDISGGYHPSILDAIRCATQVSNIISMNKPKDAYKVIDYKEAFRMATLGGSKVLGLEKQTGTFAVGLEFDALRIDTKVNNSPVDIFKKDSLMDMIQKFFYLGDDRNIVEVYVAGNKVVPFNNN